MRRFHVKATGLISVLILALTLMGCTRNRPEPAVPTSAPAGQGQQAPGAALPTTTQEGAPTTIAILPTATPTAVLAAPTPIQVEAAPTTPAEAEAAATPTPVTSVANPQVGAETIHIVQPGENLFRIGLKYGVDAKTLAQYNGISDPDKIYVGQQIKIPDGGAAPEAGNVHIVRPGDTLSSIAAQYGVSAQALMAANNLTNPDFIYVGQKLVIP